MFYVKYKDNGIYVRINSLIFLFFCLSLQNFHVMANCQKGKRKGCIEVAGSTDGETAWQRQFKQEFFARQRMDEL